MSQSGTQQPSGLSKQDSRQQREENDSSRMDVDEPQPIEDLFTRNEVNLTQKEIDAIPTEDLISYDDDDNKSSPPPPASANPLEPLGSAPAMSAALDELLPVPSVPVTGTVGRRPGPNENVYALLKEAVDADKKAIEAARKAAEAAVERDRNAEAAKTAATGRMPGPRPEKRDRTASIDSPTVSGKRAKSELPAPNPHVMDMRQENPTSTRPKRFDHLFKPDPSWCAVQIDGNKIMGNPFRPTPGWDLKFSLDPGKLGQPSVGLNFRFSKDGASHSKSKDHYNTFALGWEPGVNIDGEWMMEHLLFQQANSPINAKALEITYPDYIKELCEKHEGAADRLVCAVFKSNVHKSSPMSLDWARALKSDDRAAVLANLERMYRTGRSAYKVKVWFLRPRGELELFSTSSLEPLADAVHEHTPPFHQYMDDNNEPIIHFQMPSIDVIGNGMYRMSPKVIDKAAKIARHRPVNYVTFPKTVTWDSIKTFHITYGVPVVRDMQFTKGVHSHIEKDWHGVFIQPMPVFPVDGKEVRPTEGMHRTWQAGVRMTRNPETGMRAAIPPNGTIVLINFYNGNSREKRAHETNKDDFCFGRVDSYGGKAWLEKTKTDFCVLMTVPKHLKVHVHPQATYKRSLPMAKIIVKVDHTSAQRDIDAFSKFCDEEYAPELLDRIRLAFWSNPSKISELTDLTLGPAHDRSMANKEKYFALLRELKKKRLSNESQDRAYSSAARMHNKIAVIQGPPGAGKTRTLRDMVVSMAKIGHKVLCVASSNVAVDTDANAVWDALTPEERKTYKCLRLETGGAERAQRLWKVGYGAYTGEEGEADKFPEYLGPKQALDHPAIRNGLDKLYMAYATGDRVEEAADVLKNYENVNRALQAVENYDAIKRVGVHSGMTPDYRMWELTEEDRHQAHEDYKAAREAMSSDELARQFETREISVDKFDKSAKYRQAMANYKAKNGKVTRKQAQELEDEYDKMADRVLEATHILFTTASNCGGSLLEDNHSFEPTAIFCDETGQISVPSLCVPLTTFTKWEGLFLFGDVQQLEPTALSGSFNEFIMNAKVSPLALLAMKNFRNILLDTQYRMAPACSLFPRHQFYDGEGLKDSDAVRKDNEVRRKVRKMTLDLGVKGDIGQGSEYAVTSVANGCSRVEINGTSLVNHANADVVMGMINKLIEAGVPAATIKILAYYQGQRRLIRRKIDGSAWNDAVKNAIEISTVDAFQGRESKVVIVDMVAAKDNLRFQPRMEVDEDEDEADTGGEDYIKVGTVTGHVKSPNRLNVALTRGKDATLVVCQASLLQRAMRKNRGKQYNAITNMVIDARNRNCFHVDDREDSHPDSVKAREQQSKAATTRARAHERNQDLSFIAEAKIDWRNFKQTPAIPKSDPRPIYRTRRGPTTRPIGNPKLIAQADRFDEERRQFKAAKEASLTSKAAHEEDQLNLMRGVQISLIPSEFPDLPPSKAKKQPSAAAKVRDEDGESDDESVGFIAAEDSDDDDAGAGIARSPGASIHEMMDAGEDDPQFGSK